MWIIKSRIKLKFAAHSKVETKGGINVYN